jgi:Fic family protein
MVAALPGRAATWEGIREIHDSFCRLLPGELLKVEDPATEETLTLEPGALRARDVIVGRHVAISAGALPRFLKRFEEVYGSRGHFEQVLSIGAAHHRLLWIHPFLDGNGRVARLMSHAMELEALDSGGVWSISRGLARPESEYMRHLAECDLERRNDYSFTKLLTPQTAGEPTSGQHERGKKLAYVSFSRARENLRIILFTPSPDAARKELLRQQLLEPDQIVIA